MTVARDKGPHQAAMCLTGGGAVGRKHRYTHGDPGRELQIHPEPMLEWFDQHTS